MIGMIYNGNTRQLIDTKYNRMNESEYIDDDIAQSYRQGNVWKKYDLIYDWLQYKT